MKKACIQLPSATWTMLYDTNKNGTINILDFNREDQEGYTNPELLGNLERVIEDAAGAVTTVIIDGVELDVANRQGLFSYKAPL